MIEKKSNGRALAALALLLSLTGLFVLIVFKHVYASTPSSSDPILRTLDTTLTNYGATAASPIQSVRPVHGQRGVDFDGSARSPMAFPFSIHGNPFSHAQTPNTPTGDVRLSTGTYNAFDTDLALPSVGFSWPISRSYNAIQDDSGHYDSDGYQGANWYQNSQCELVCEEGATDDDDIFYLIYGADRFIAFDRVSSTSDTYRAVNGAAGVIEYDSSSNLYTYTAQNGYQMLFIGRESDGCERTGWMWRVVDPAGNEAYVGHPSNVVSALLGGFDTSGRVLKAYDTADRRYTYTYTTIESVGRLTKIVVETQSGGSWQGTPQNVTEVARVEYDYYETSDTHGTKGDLKWVEIKLPMEETGVYDVRRKYYRYWKDADTEGDDHMLKYVVEPEGCRRHDWDQDSEIEDPDAVGGSDPEYFTETDANLEPYASAYFEYNSDNQISLAWFNGDCGCSGGGANGIYEYDYEASGYTNTSGYDTAWASRTIVERPDMTWVTQYFDETHQHLSVVVTDADPALSPTSEWVYKIVRDANGVVTSTHSPANSDTYTHSTGAITSKTSVGLVRNFGLETTGAVDRFLSEITWQEGTAGTEYYELVRMYDTAHLQMGDDYVVRPVIDEIRHFWDMATSSSSGYDDTIFSTTFVSTTATQGSYSATEAILNRAGVRLR